MSRPDMYFRSGQAERDERSNTAYVKALKAMAAFERETHDADCPYPEGGEPCRCEAMSRALQAASQ